VADDDLAILLGGIFFVRENPRQSIAEDRSCLGERDPVFLQIGEIFAWIPFKDQIHFSSSRIPA
jgi:hypothetical protein